MLRTLALAATFVLISCPAQAGKSCDQPYAPDIPSRTSLTKVEAAALRDDAQTFIAASDVYQECLQKSLRSNSITAAEYNVRLTDSQHKKELIGKQVNDLLAAYHASAQTNAKVSDASH